MVLVVTVYSILLTSYEDHVSDKQLCLTCISSLNKVYYYYIMTQSIYQYSVPQIEYPLGGQQQKRQSCLIPVASSLVNPLGTGDLKFYQSQGLSTFWGLFIFFNKPIFYLSWQPVLLIIHHVSRAHVPLTTIYNFFGHHQVHDALNDITITPP